MTVIIDRLKPAHLLLDNVNSSESKLDSPRVDTSSPTPSAKEPEKSAMPLPEKSSILTRTGRRVHFPAKGSILHPILTPKVYHRLNANISFEEFLQVDDPLATCGTLTDAEIVDNVRGVSED
ncbi:hypothetical protein AVEN_146530-1 [Araneus ventricosus]|uniref:Uncharacterized protein n=1 Tax=Araneus ventricosus TaxID=182803 RepID=A0A4Y2TQP4_ARAVE|nr:hypothetical protein AVEN_146530-1 [Araneus ventricosus]